jgi:alpha/beta superfamily hydrolase
MSPSHSEQLRIDVSRGWLHALLDLPAQPRAAVLLVPPLFHEWQRSYRLFALLAECLAQRGVAVLRFDYRGCGDSWGEDSEFLPSRALEDIRAALAALEQHARCHAALLGVRGGGLLAAAAAAGLERALWLWQPVVEGAAHLAELRRRDAEELGSRWRFPFLRRAPAADPLQLMGQRLHPEFAVEFGLLKLAAPGLPAPALWLHAEADPAPEQVPALVLPAALSSWAGELDISGRFTLPPVRELASTLATRLVSKEAA